jgi:hypothetical protein
LQEDEMARWKRSAALVLPPDLEYSKDAFPSFSAEELEKLRTARPATLHAASQIQGVTPHALIYLHTYVTRGRHHQFRRDNAAVAAAAAAAGGVMGDGEDGAMHPDFFVSPKEAGLRKHYQEIDDVADA